MKKMFALAVCFLLVAGSAISQNTAVDSVKIAIGKLFSAIHNSDAFALRQAFTDSATYQTVNRDKNGDGVVKATSVIEWAFLITRMPRGTADPRINFDMVKTDGPLATAWVPYKMYFDNRLLYCGINSIQLVRVNGIWKIQYLIDKKSTTDCVQ